MVNENKRTKCYFIPDWYQPLYCILILPNKVIQYEKNCSYLGWKNNRGNVICLCSKIELKNFVISFQINTNLDIVSTFFKIILSNLRSNQALWKNSSYQRTTHNRGKGLRRCGGIESGNYLLFHLKSMPTFRLYPGPPKWSYPIRDQIKY